MKITKEQALKALETIDTMVGNLDFIGCLTDEEYTGFIEEITTISRYIRQEGK